MIIIGCDFHTPYQQIAMADDETGELLLERRLDHQRGEAHAFYRTLAGGRSLIPKNVFGLVYCKGWGLSLECENKN
jgi:hypothetical protein